MRTKARDCVLWWSTVEEEVWKVHVELRRARGEGAHAARVRARHWPMRPPDPSALLHAAAVSHHLHLHIAYVRHTRLVALCSFGFVVFETMPRAMRTAQRFGHFGTQSH
jgi:hypothetical protein